MSTYSPPVGPAEGDVAFWWRVAMDVLQALGWRELGCTQVVKRQTIPDIGNDDEVPISGRKRHVQQRLGNNVVVSDSYRSRHSNKRFIVELSSYIW
uniref:Uncharacterized protein n=1 Tax=Triticum urartu TaxID=4572 RepID=A0A8R7QEL2_TRIUA